MLKRLRTAHPILYCILSEVLFLGSMVVFSLLATIVLAAAGADFDTMDGYLLGSAVQEAVGLVVALLLLACTGRLDLLHRRGCGFLNGMLVGMYPLFFIGYTTVGTLAFDRPDTPLLPLPRILTFMLNMILVGVAEELVFRGIIAQTLLERYGTAVRGVGSLPCVRRAVWRGAPEQPARLGTLWRADAVRVCGFAGRDAGRHLLPHRQFVGDGIPARCHGYFVHAHRWAVRHHYRGRCGKRLRCIHAASVLLYLIPTAVLLRKKKLPEVQLYWHQYVKK